MLNFMIAGLGRGLRLYAFFFVVLAMFRIAFIAVMQSYIGGAAGAGDVFVSLAHGMMLSMKTTGLIVLLVWLPSFAVGMVMPLAGKIIEAMLSAITLVLLSILFIARFPFYHLFHSTYNQAVFNALNDDVHALIVTFYEEYALLPRLGVAILLAAVLFLIMRFFMKRMELRVSLSGHAAIKKMLTLIALFAMAALVALLSTFGGALGWQSELTWENAGTTRDHFLNEAMLDDPMALYRGYELAGRQQSSSGLDYTAADVKKYASWLMGKPQSDDVISMLHHRASGAMMEPPRHIFLIIGESYANWPLLDKYEALHIADGMKGIIAEDNTAYCQRLLPNGAFTVSAVTGIVTGLADANLYLTTMPESYEAPFETAAAPMMKSLGYHTHFWYAGPASWERVGPFVLAQGFDEFTGRGDIDGGGSVWGADDEYLYEAILRGLASAPDEPSFNVILNTSNHSPFTVDVEAKGFDAARTRAALPASERGDESLVRALGHYWYEDREMARFIREAEKRYPDALFIVVGDHADRVNVTKTPTTYERFVVPLIIHGRGINRDMMAGAAGSQIDIMPTLVELIAPRGHVYTSLGESLTTSRRGVSYMLWINDTAIGKTDEAPLVAEPINENEGMEPTVNQSDMQRYIDAVRSISMWIGKRGKIE